MGHVLQAVSYAGSTSLWVAREIDECFTPWYGQPVSESDEKLRGLERLLGTCRRLGLSLETRPPARHPPEAGTLIGGHPLEPLLAVFYGRLGGASFAFKEAGLILFSRDDTTNELEERSQRWRSNWQEELALPLFVFAGEPLLAHYFATVPGLADAEGRQPVVRVDTYEDPYALPIASSVDRLFELYSLYLEELVSTPGYEDEGCAVLTFPWDVPHLLAHDERLVELMRGGHFDPLLPSPADSSVQRWFSRILIAASHD